MEIALENDQTPFPAARSIKSIHLKRRNWENNGTDTYINPGGTFEVYAYLAGESRRVRAGFVDKDAVQALVTEIHDTRFLTLPEEYGAPPGDFSWWGYELIVETEQGVKSVRFHSADPAIPDGLKGIVQHIQDLAR